MTACALIFSYVEYLVPVNIGVPGIKLGLANIVIIVALYKMGIKYAFTINLVRIAISALLFSGVSGLMFGLTGGILSLTAMALLKKLDLFSVVWVSVFGGIVHNMGQLLVAALLLANFAVVYYLPVLLVSGALTGACIGFLARILLLALQRQK